MRCVLVIGHIFPRIKYILNSSWMFLSSPMDLLVVLTKGITTLPANYQPLARHFYIL